MDREKLLNRLELHNKVLVDAVADVSHEEALVVPEKGGNSINWLVGHLLVSRADLLMAMREKDPLPDGFREIYSRGTDSRKGSPLFPFEEVKDLWELVHVLLRQMLMRLDRDVSVAGSDETAALPVDRLELSLFHEAYHIGQVALLRRIIGKEGVIK